MTGYVTDEQTKDAILAGIDGAMDVRGLPRYWTPGAQRIHSGPSEGQWFIPASDKLLATPLHGRPPLTPMDFPETAHMIEMLGGLDARIEIDPADLIDPESNDQ